MNRRKEDPPLYAEVINACKERHPSIAWELVERELHGTTVYKLIGHRGEVRTFERIEVNPKTITSTNAESVSDIIAERIARIEKHGL